MVGVVSALPEGHSTAKLLEGQQPEQLGPDGGAGGARACGWSLHRQPHQHGLQRHDLAVRQQRMTELRDGPPSMFPPPPRQPCCYDNKWETSYPNRFQLGTGGRNAKQCFVLQGSVEWTSFIYTSTIFQCIVCFFNDFISINGWALCYWSLDLLFG